MNDPFFVLFLGMSVFAVIYAVFVGYLLYQDSSYLKKKMIKSRKKVKNNQK